MVACSGSLRWRARQGTVAGGEEVMPRPVGCEMKPEAADTADDAARDCEQVEPDRADRRRRQARPAEDGAAEVREQQQRDAGKLQPEGVRAEAMTDETIGVDVELEFFDPILGRPAVVVPRDEIRGTPASIRDHESQSEPLGGDIDLDEDASRVRPRPTTSGIVTRSARKGRSGPTSRPTTTSASRACARWRSSASCR